MIALLAMIPLIGLEATATDLLAKFGGIPVARASVAVVSLFAAYHARHLRDGLVVASRASAWAMYGLAAIGLLVAVGIFDGVDVNPIINAVKWVREFL